MFEPRRAARDSPLQLLLGRHPPRLVVAHGRRVALCRLPARRARLVRRDGQPLRQRSHLGVALVQLLARLGEVALARRERVPQAERLLLRRDVRTLLRRERVVARGQHLVPVRRLVCELHLRFDERLRRLALLAQQPRHRLCERRDLGAPLLERAVALGGGGLLRRQLPPQLIHSRLGLLQLLVH